MSVFIGWSGKSTKSHQVAEALRDWLGQVIQGCDPWISTVDIDDPLQSIRHERAGSQKSLALYLIAINAVRPTTGIAAASNSVRLWGE
jgi:hypothetical protein